jgi:hypothetical protein
VGGDIDKQELTSDEKIILPEKLQREMMKFFLKTSIPKIALLDREKQQSPENLVECDDA